jgi:hypothetical protein
MIRHHLLIAGTGRAGTSLLVRILTACGLDTELSRNPKTFWDETASAGLETIPLLRGEHPYVVKCPWSHQFVRQLLDDPTIALDGVVVPIRSLEEAASSRIILEIQQMYRTMPAMVELHERWTEWGSTPGGLTYSLQPLDAARILAQSLHRLIEALVPQEVPLHFLAFPRFCTDLEYLRRVLLPLLPSDLDAATFVDRVSPLIEQHKIRVRGEIDETKREVIDDASEPTYPKLSTLYEAALKREVKRLLTELSVAGTQLETATGQRDAMVAECQQVQKLLANSNNANVKLNVLCEQLNQQLRERETKISQLHMDVTKLHTEVAGRAEAIQISRLQADLAKVHTALTERTSETEQLRGQIDSIHTSICWRVTWPIRWFHKLVTRGRISRLTRNG